MVWISLVPQWSRTEVNIFGYLNGNCSMVPLFKEDSQVSIISIPQFLPYRISFTLPPLEGTRWTLVQFERFCDLWTSQRNPLEVPVQLGCRATFPHINNCPNTFPTQNWDVQERFIQHIKEPASVEVTFSTILSNHKMPALTRKWTTTHVLKKGVNNIKSWRKVNSNTGQGFPSPGRGVKVGEQLVEEIFNKGRKPG